MNIQKCFRLQHHHTLPWALRHLRRFRLGTDTSRVPLFDDNESGTCVQATFGQEYGATTESLQPLEPQHPPTQTSSLLCLPRELLLQIMILSPHSSLYMVYQTCGFFRHLLGGFEFKYFRLEMLRSNEEAYCITKAGFDELFIVKSLFRRRSLCDPCGKLFDSGELDKRLRALWKPVLCTGCNRRHPELLFPQGQRTEHRCVGLLGHFAVCKHLKISGKTLDIPWRKIERREDDEVVMTCKHPDHVSVYDKYDGLLSGHIFQPRIKYWPTLTGSGSEYSRSFPMVKIRRRQDVDIGKLRSILLKQLQELDGDGLCQHASGQLESIASFMTLDKHRCLSKGSTWCHNHECPDCTYACNECGARYRWVWERNCVILRIRMKKYFFYPNSINWLSNLSFETDEHPILNKDTKNVLWCSSPGCGTGSGERWLLMVEIFQRHNLCYCVKERELEVRCMTSLDRLFLTLEHQTLQDVKYWRAGHGPGGY
ncbi:uncharacterized protein FFB14_06002 [Fusarium fujikuroi]|nr:uncharacterized protein FFB14_06002 [Fusarium fujikuroi]